MFGFEEREGGWRDEAGGSDDVMVSPNSFLFLLHYMKKSPTSVGPFYIRAGIIEGQTKVAKNRLDLCLPVLSAGKKIDS